MAGLSNSYPQYAPIGDLEAYLDDTLIDDAEGNGLLQRASGVVRDWTKTAIYRTDANGLPTDTLVKNAFHDAAILQAAGYRRAGVKPGDLVATLTPGIQSKSLGGRSVTYAADSSATSAKAELLRGRLTPEAASVLSSAGLLGAGVSVGGGSTYDVLLRRWIG